MIRFHSNGKILLTGEYLVLKGALALALPVNLGQSLEIKDLETNNNRLYWKALQPKGPWFSATLDKSDLQVVSADDEAKAQKLSEMLRTLRELNASVFMGNDLQITTQLEFDPEWGLGSSSTLISNLAQWAKVNPYELLKRTFGGSGYDIACATAKGSIFYQLVDGQPKSESAPFEPAFADKLFFVYQGKKQSSAKEVIRFKERMAQIDLCHEIEQVSDISRAMCGCKDLSGFCCLLDEHEAIMSHCLDREPLKKRFPDFEGSVKSLGAWGGDFFLCATKWDEHKVRSYFQSNGMNTVLRYLDLV